MIASSLTAPRPRLGLEARPCELQDFGLTVFFAKALSKRKAKAFLSLISYLLVSTETFWNGLLVS